jgi:cyanate lyase
VGQSKEWTTAALLGQMQMTKEQAEAAGKLLGLPGRRRPAAAAGSVQGLAAHGGPNRSLDLPLLRARDDLRHDLQGADPRRVWRRHHERDRFQDESDARADPKGDRVKIEMSGKYLQYKTY